MFDSLVDQAVLGIPLAGPPMNGRDFDRLCSVMQEPLQQVLKQVMKAKPLVVIIKPD